MLFTDTDTDFSESEALSSFQISEKTKNQTMSPPSQSEPEDTGSYSFVYFNCGD